MHLTRNDGIYQTGGTIQAGQIAVGRNASIAIGRLATAREALDSRGLLEIRERLDDLVAALQAHGTSLTDRRGVVASTHKVLGELSSPTPDKATIIGTLSRIADAVKSVGSIATAATALKTAVSLML